MKSRTTACAAFVGALLLVGLTASQGNCQGPASPSNHGLPVWAYAVPPLEPHPQAQHRPSPPENKVFHIPGSAAGFTQKQIHNGFLIADWFPNQHPPMPQAVRQGTPPDVYACALCHLPNGLGRPENESVAGLPKAYILEQLKNFKDGMRHSSQPRMDSVRAMIIIARKTTPQQWEEGADYFSSLKLTPWIKVVETNTVPKTRVSGGMLVPDGTSTEPIGDRVIEVPADVHLTELRDPDSGFIAYVPKGSVKAGENLVRTGGGGTTIACAICHGENLRGMGDIPGIAGRSPSEMARQLIDFQDGARRGGQAVMMEQPVAKLTTKNIVDITAYLASLKP